MRGRFKTGNGDVQFPTVRRIKDQPNQAATMVDLPSHLLVADIDGKAMPPGVTWGSNLEDIGRAAVREFLPPQFHDASFVIKASASAGMSEDLRCHLYFFSDDYIYGNVMRRYFHGLGLDGSVYTATQPIYTGKPVFVGMEDPLPRRFAIAEGKTDRVKGLALVTNGPAEDGDVMERESPWDGPVRLGKAPKRRGKGDPIDRAKAALVALGDGDGKQGYHRPIYRAVLAYLANGGDDFGEIAGLIKEEISARADRSASQIARYLEDNYLRAEFDSAAQYLQHHDE